MEESEKIEILGVYSDSEYEWIPLSLNKYTRETALGKPVYSSVDDKYYLAYESTEQITNMHELYKVGQVYFNTKKVYWIKSSDAYDSFYVLVSTEMAEDAFATLYKDKNRKPQLFTIRA
jgi:hypothetical protein